MPTDHAHGGGSGPRHAAPRKPLLARLNMPAGKAVALAAMPTAVLMGMGFTPTLAQAKPMPPNPFGDGPCAAAPDRSPEPDPGASQGGADEGKADEGKGANTPTAPTASGGSAGGGERPGARDRASGLAASPAEAARRSSSPSASPSASPSVTPSPSATSSPSASPSASPSSSASEAARPLDPLGLGGLLGGLLSGGRHDAPPPARGSSPAPSATPSAGRGADGGTGSTARTAGPGGSAPDRAETTAPGPGKSPSPGASANPSAHPSANPSAHPSTSPDANPSAGASTGATATPAPDGEKRPYPCPTYDPKALAAAEPEVGAVLPNQPWYLESSVLTLEGLKYEGVKRVTMANKQEKPVLKFTADAVRIRDLHQIVNSVEADGGHPRQYHVTGFGHAEKDVPTITGGKVTMYTEELSGKLFGVVPVTFTPAKPPPLTLPLLVFTDVRIRQAGQFGGTLRVPTLHQYSTDGVYNP
ncbi:hypothetical protein ACFYZH_01495 [Streptomyces abikoensis]|uniref:hypothetical protein n=1 Tax=Streptomyces abikoensis TaxID=97398 RepID=UPI00368A04AF